MIPKYKTTVLHLYIFLFFCGFSTFNQLGATEKYNFNHGWRLHVGDAVGAESKDYNDQTWKSVTLPYAWNQEEAFKLDIAQLSTGIAWYRKIFQLPVGEKPAKIFVEFEGVRQVGEVYVNGHFIGRHENGVMAFGYDISNFLQAYPQQNVIAVKTNNDWNYTEKETGTKYQWNNINFNANYGGIPKNVFLHTTSKVYQTLPLYASLGTTGTYVYAKDMDVKNKKAVVHVEAQVRNESSKPVLAHLAIEVEDMHGKKVAAYNGIKTLVAPSGMSELEAADTIKNLEFWSWGYGYLYDVYATVMVDTTAMDKVKIRTGFRKTAFKDGMIYLNERVIMMKGYAQRTSNEWPSVGMSVPPWLSDYSNRLITEGNGNMIRWMHVTPWKQDVESCDRVGLIQAMPAGDAEKDVSDHRWKQRTDLMRDAIIYNRNNPSILFYECGNENISEKHMAEMKTIRDKYDPFGGRAIGSREMLDSEVAEYGGEMLYINKSADIPFWAMEYSRDEGLRKYWDNYSPPFHPDGAGPKYKGKDASEYNRNQDSHAIENVVRWFDYWEMRPGTGKRVSSGGANIVFSDTNTHHRGEENYRRSGEVDPMRIPKDNYWAHKVIWDGWVDTDTLRAHILGHWNYAKLVVKDITVVSTARTVELFRNGKSLGKGTQSKRFLFTFKDVAFEPGELKAVGYNAAGVAVCQDIRKTAGEPKALELSIISRPGGILANGHDLAIIQVEVVDKEGIRCPTALNMIHFEVKGEGEFIGGIAQGRNNFIGSPYIPVECGVNRVFIRSSKTAGTLQVKAVAEGLKSAGLKIETLPADMQPLSKVMPSEGLPFNLDKGPTPDTTSYHISRIPIQIAGAKAGINEAQVSYSYDDNEMTLWSNNDVLKSGWVTYELEREATIQSVCMKLSGWRTRSYPLTIKVGEEEVFSGNTPRSLGYITFDFNPVKGKEVTVQLTGTSAIKDEFDMVEITGQKDEATLKDFEETKAGSLKILEIEFYEPVATSDSIMAQN